MKNALMILALADTIFPAFGFAEEMTVARAKHLIIIGVDGMSPDGIRHAKTPVMDRLMRDGSYSFHARCVLPSSSSANWASMIMGVGPEMHGITSNDWDREESMSPPVVTGSEDIFPTIFGVLRKARPAAAIGAIYHWDGFGRLFERNGVSFDHPAVSEEDAAVTAARYIREVKPAFTSFIWITSTEQATPLAMVLPNIMPQSVKQILLSGRSSMRPARQASRRTWSSSSARIMVVSAGDMEESRWRKQRSLSSLPGKESGRSGAGATHIYL